MESGAEKLVTAESARHDGAVPGTIEVWSDIACPWASLAVHRLFRTRARLGLDDEVRLNHRAFPLELHNGRPTPRRILDAEVPVLGSHEPELGWTGWSGAPENWPGTVLIALEAVQAAKAEAVGGLAASEQLDHALRAAFYVDHRPIGLLTEVLAVAGECASLDAAALEQALGRGSGRAEVVRDWRHAEARGVKGSPHLFLPDGTDLHNPGITMTWSLGQPGKGFPLITADDVGVYEGLLRRALAPAG
jgi:predicted DsbA family dithiol-disulfide isomerase